MLSVTICLGAVVEGAGRLVEEEDLRLVDDGAGDHQALALAAGQRAAAFRDVGVHAHRHVADVLGQARLLGRLPGVLERAGAGAADVAEDLGRHHAADLQHDAHLLAQHAHVDRRQVLAVEVDGARRRLLEAEHQAHQRRLAAARRADEGDELAGLDLERQVADDRRPVLRVAEGDVRDVDRAGQPAGEALRAIDLGRRLEDRDDALVDRDDAQQVERGVAERLHGAEEQAVGRVEGDERADRQPRLAALGGLGLLATS